jgi:putative ABC transport system ATP-binding protein
LNHQIVLMRVSKIYRTGSVTVVALRDVNLEIHANRFTVLSGPSGSGKTTLLNLMGCIDRADGGEVLVSGQPVHALTDNALSDFRARHVGFIFQNFNLLPVLTAFENIEYPLLPLKMSITQRCARVMELLDAVGLADRAGNRPSELSGGQRQRVAIARALAASPKWILADEPTANLDSETGAAVIALMRKIQRELNVSFIFSSHDPAVIAEADDAIFLRDGRITNVARRHALA